MLMALGMFVFSISNLAFHELQRQTSWRHPSNSRVGASPAHQYVGHGDDTIALSGVLVPETVGRPQSLKELREMGDTGKAWVLAAGTGEIFGAFAIESLNETGSMHIDNGAPRRVDFQLQLRRVDDRKSGARVAVGNLGDFNAQGMFG